MIHTTSTAEMVEICSELTRAGMRYVAAWSLGRWQIEVTGY